MSLSLWYEKVLNRSSCLLIVGGNSDLNMPSHVLKPLPKE
jgi:hypothetical protein